MRLRAGGYRQLAAGTYSEDVNLNESVTLLGAGAASTTIRGVIGGDAATVRVNVSNATIAGFTITREGNNVADWNNAGLNSAGIAVQGQVVTGLVVRDNVITGNRTAIDVNNSNGHTIRNNVISNNHTGLIFRNQTDNITVVENFITDNRTVGVLFLDASGGTNSPIQSAANSTFSNNNLSGNWYGQIVDRQAGGALPVPGTTNLKNFSGNWLGTTVPVITTANSAEPGYASLIPVEFGGTAVAPGGQPDIAGLASANFDITPLLGSGGDLNIETTPGRGTFGFPGRLLRPHRYECTGPNRPFRTRPGGGQPFYRDDADGHRRGWHVCRECDHSQGPESRRIRCDYHPESLRRDRDRYHFPGEQRRAAELPHHRGGERDQRQQPDSADPLGPDADRQHLRRHSFQCVDHPFPDRSRQCQ